MRFSLFWHLWIFFRKNLSGIVSNSLDSSLDTPDLDPHYLQRLFAVA